MKQIIYNALTCETTERYLTAEEIAEMEAMEQEMQNQPCTREMYEQEVERLIRQKYSINEELAIQRQRDTKPEAWQEYFDYCENCKVQARQNLNYCEETKN